MTEITTTDPTRAGADLDELVERLQSAVWTLAFAGDVGLERARRVRHGARMLAASADRLLMDAAGAAVAPPQPGLAGLVSTLVTLDRMAAVDRGRLASDVLVLARTVLRRERGRAMAQTGMSVTELAREYGISTGAVRAALGDARAALPELDLAPGGSAESRRTAPRKSGSEPMRPPGPIRDAP